MLRIVCAAGECADEVNHHSDEAADINLDARQQSQYGQIDA